MTDTTTCKRCDAKIEGDGTYGMSGLEPIEGEDEYRPVFEDGPYCGLDCLLAAGKEGPS